MRKDYEPACGLSFDGVGDEVEDVKHRRGGNGVCRGPPGLVLASSQS